MKYDFTSGETLFLLVAMIIILFSLSNYDAIIEIVKSVRETAMSVTY